jgi:class 3 adenylate cyclase
MVTTLPDGPRRRETVRVKPPIEYVRTGDVYVAYMVYGTGPYDVVAVPGRLSNIDYAWEYPPWAEWATALAGDARIIVFDRRGSGISDRPLGSPSLEDRIDDVVAVMDAASSRRAILYATGDDAAEIVVLFAATYPERVAGVILWQPEVRGAWAPDYPWAPREPGVPFSGRSFASDAHVAAAIERQFPSKIGDPDFAAWFQSFLRLSASPASYEALARMSFDSDVRHVLPSIHAPTLILHRAVADLERSRYVADRIPGARLVELPGTDRTAWSSETQPVIDAMREFMTSLWESGAWDETESERMLATVLFTDIVGSTARTAEGGDAAWRTLLEQHHALVRRQLSRFRGREVDTAGDGFFAVFDGPARAIRCAAAIVDGVRELGLEVRAGLHTGECELVDGKVAGIAVSIGARVAATAAPGEILVSSTVRDLVAGSGLAFEDRGESQLKGVPGGWRLFAVARPGDAA